MKKILITVFILICIIPCGHAFFEKDMRSLTMQNGLADNTVSCIHKDKDGFMWFGTDNGLSRYDGTDIRNFGNADSYLKVFRIRETDNSLLWLITSDGLKCFDRRLERFVPVEVSDPVTDILFADDFAWIFSARSLSVYKQEYSKDKNNNLISVRLEKEETLLTLSQEEPPFGGICLSPDGNIYITTTQCQVFIWDKESRKMIHKGKTYRVRVGINRVLFYDGFLWISTNGQGLIQYNPVSDEFTQYGYSPRNPATSVSHTDVYETVPLYDGRYLSTTWNGYTLLTPDKDTLALYTTEIYNNTASLVHRSIENRMICAYYDQTGVLWIGTSGGGVISSDLRLQFYQRFHQDTHNEIRGITKDKDGHIWLATYHNGIMRSNKPFDPQERLLFTTVYKEPGSVFSAVTTDDNGDIWFGGQEGVFMKYTYHKNIFTSYALRLNDRQVKQWHIRSLLNDSSDRLWLGTSQGLLLFDKETEQFILQPCFNGAITDLAEGIDNDLWLGTYSGIKHYSLSGNVSVEKGYEQERQIETREVRSLRLSSENKLYIGYTGGFAIMDVEADSIGSFYTTRDGLCSNSIGCIMEDARGNIWLGSNSGVSRYSRHQKLFYNYYISGNNSSALLHNEFLFWGNNMNLTYFNPDNVRHHLPATDHVKITRIEVDYKPVEIGDKINNQVVLTEGTSYTSRLILNRENNNLSLSFSNLTFSEELQKYSYRLIPFQPDWLVVNEGEKVTFANLLKGDYHFEVRSIFPDGTYGESTFLRIKILPYWYETTAARIVFIIMITLLAVWIAGRMKRKQLRLAKEERLRHELELTNVEREKEKQIYQERENFFTNVSHELRTPLTLIISPLQELLQTEQVSPSLHDKLELMYGNAQSLSTLMNQLLYVQKIEAGMVELHLSETDIITLVQKVVTSFRPLIRMKGIDFSCDFQAGELRLWIDAPKMESALTNLLSNALKYTPDNHRITVKVDTRLIDNQPFCLVSVNDTGKGIAPEMQEKVFESFITGPSDPSFSTKIGIGLRIVKHTMDLHHGKVELQSSPGKGSSFTLYIPVGNEHFKDDAYELIPCSSEPRQENMQDSFTLSARTSAHHPRYTLLLIEDNAEMRAYIRSLFVKDYHILEAENGEEGVRLAGEHHPDLILSDIMMPVMDGFTACKLLKEQLKTAHIPVIMLTAKAEDADVVKSLKIGVDDYIMKPFNPEVLKIKVESIIRSREQLKRIYTKTLLLQQEADTVPGEDPKDDFMQHVIQLVEINLTNPDFSAKVLADMLCVSQPTLYRKIKQYTGQSIIEVIRSIRMSKSASLIIQKKYSIQEVCEMVGYNDINTFRKHFTNQFGVSPSKYNKEF